MIKKKLDRKPNMSSDYDGEGETPPAPPVRHTSSRPLEGPHGGTTTLSAHGGHTEKPLPREPEKKPKTPKIKRGEKKEVLWVTECDFAVYPIPVTKTKLR